MKNHLVIAIVAVCALLSSCGGGADSGLAGRLMEERDSLILLSREQTRRLDAINNMMATINATLDSISQVENVLFFNADSEGKFSRQTALDDLANYEMLLRRQQSKIHELHLRLGEDSPEGVGILQVMRQQLDAKDMMIAKLKEQLSQKDVDIVRLRKTVTEQGSTIVRQEKKIGELTEVNKAQTKALIRQDEMLNNCYVIIASKIQLEKAGIVKRGKIVSDAAFNNSMFMKVDIRKANEFAFQALRPRILSSMPQSSYMLMNNGGNNYTLKVTNPAAFWGITSYLVIQTE